MGIATRRLVLWLHPDGINEPDNIEQERFKCSK